MPPPTPNSSSFLWSDVIAVKRAAAIATVTGLCAACGTAIRQSYTKRGQRSTATSRITFNTQAKKVTRFIAGLVDGFWISRAIRSLPASDAPFVCVVHPSVH